MKVLFYRYGSIVEQHMVDCFNRYGLDIVQDTRHITNHDVSSEQIISDISSKLLSETFLFVFSINFFPEVSEVCNIHKILYVCWTVDSPFIQLFSDSLNNEYNRIFFFDKAQYEKFSPYICNGKGYHLPLAGNPSHFETYIRTASSQDNSRFSSDISMVGSLYKEKNPYPLIEGKSDYLMGYIDSIERAQMLIFGENLIENLLNDKVMNEFEQLVPDIQSPTMTVEEKKYKVAHFIIGSDLAYHERIKTLNRLAKNHNVDLYTLSDTSELQNVNVKGSANTFTEMPIIFNRSKINLNITIRPIITGLSQRVYDVLSCGGFLITNYQQELDELFEIGNDLECYTSLEELDDKVNFYLAHDSLRSQIAQNGLNKIKQCHSFEHRFKEMLETILNEVK